MDTFITDFCKIENGKVIVNDKLVYENSEVSDFNQFIKAVYQEFDLNYPKFFKMDSLCKLAVTSTTVLMDVTKLSPKEDMALVFSNKSSCIDVDLKHQSTISNPEEYFPSPANFVYTLPNIALGEISIKYKLKSENSFFIFEDFNPKFMVDYSGSLLHLKKSSSVLCAWVEVYENDYKAFVYKVEKTGSLLNTKENLLNLFS